MNKWPATERSAPDLQDFDEAEVFLHLLQKFQREVVSTLSPHLKGHGLDFRMYFVLRQIQAGAGYPGSLSKLMELPNSVITRLIGQLVDLKLVVRNLDETDSRRIRLTLTTEGVSVSRAAQRTARRIVNARLERLAPKSRKEFLTAFKNLVSDD